MNGELEFGLQYDMHTERLTVSVLRCKDVKHAEPTDG